MDGEGKGKLEVSCGRDESVYIDMDISRRPLSGRPSGRLRSSVGISLRISSDPVCNCLSMFLERCASLVADWLSSDTFERSHASASPVRMKN